MLVELGVVVKSARLVYERHSLAMNSLSTAIGSVVTLRVLLASP